MQGFLQSVRLELKPSGAHVLITCPGFTESNIRKTALTATGGQQSESPLVEDKLMSAEAVAEAIFNATARRQRTLVLTSQGKLTAFLNKIAPAFLESQVLKLFQKEANSPLAER
jgi:short-subunit dehydrogenase